MIGVNSTIIVLGNGDVAIGSNPNNATLTFRELYEIRNVGDSLPDDIHFMDYDAAITLDYPTYVRFHELIGMVVKGEATEFEICGHLFRFENDIQGAAQCLIKQVNRAGYLILLWQAC